MATTRKSTTKKSRAAKKPAARAAAKKTTTKTTVKKTIKKAPVATADLKIANAGSSVTKTTVKNAEGTTRTALEKLRTWNLAAFMLFLAQAVGIVLLSNERTLPVTTSYTTTDSLASLDAERVLVSGWKVLYDVRVAWALAAVLGVLALTNLVLATLRRKQYEQGLKSGINKIRWIGHGVSTGLMMVVLAMVTGISDKPLLAMILVASALSCVAAYYSERNNQGVRPKDWSFYLINVLLGVAAWLVLAWYVFASWRYGAALQPAWVLVLLGSMLVVGLAFPLIHRLGLKGQNRWGDYINVDKAYLLASIVASAALTWQVYAGLLR